MYTAYKCDFIGHRAETVTMYAEFQKGVDEHIHTVAMRYLARRLIQVNES